MFLKTFPQGKLQIQMASLHVSKYLRRKNNLTQTLPETEIEEILNTSFYETRFCPKPDKILQEIKIAEQSHS